MNAMGPSLGAPDSVPLISSDVTASLQTTDRAGCESMQCTLPLATCELLPGAIPPSHLFLVKTADELFPQIGLCLWSNAQLEFTGLRHFVLMQVWSSCETLSLTKAVELFSEPAVSRMGPNSQSSLNMNHDLPLYSSGLRFYFPSGGR